MENTNRAIYVLPAELVDDEDLIVRAATGIVRVRDGRAERLEGDEAERVWRAMRAARPANEAW